MAQSAITVTPPNPTPPTNLSCVGATPPLDILQVAVDDGVPAPTATLASINETSGSRVVIAAKTAALGSGTSLDGEGKGTETVVTAPGNIDYTYPNSGTLSTGKSFSDLGNYTSVATAAGVINSPNATHASSLSPAVNPTLTSITPGTSVSGAGTTTLTATGVGFTRQSVVYVNGVPQTTVFASSTSLTCAAVTKKATAGPWPVTVVTGGVVTTAAQTWTWT